MEESVTHGTLMPKDRIITSIVRDAKGWLFRGYTEFQFGFRHEWEVGPYKTVQQGLDDFEARGVGCRIDNIPEGESV